MQVYVLEQWRYLVYSIIGGILIGIAHDLLCNMPLALSAKRKHSFFCDALFIIVVAIVTAVLSYSTNDGIYRVYPFLASMASFGIYRISVGKAVLSFNLFIFDKIRAFGDYLFKKFKLVLDISVKFVKMIIANLRIRVYKKSLLKKIETEFSGKERYGKQK